MERDFAPGPEEVRAVLRDFGIAGEPEDIRELLRYNYRRHDPGSGEIRLILRVGLRGRAPVVLKLVNEREHPHELIEAQAAFAELLRQRGVLTPRHYACAEGYCAERRLDGARVDVTAEDFCEGELKRVGRDNIGGIGALLARMHSISEQCECHVRGRVLFDVLTRNDLTGFDRISGLAPRLHGPALARFEQVRALHAARRARLEVLRARPRYAVQGDMSDCNMFVSAGGGLGVFDFNNCGDNCLYTDAVMQGVFVARLMDYDAPITFGQSRELFCDFMRGYAGVRPLSAEDRALLPDMWAVINGLWLADTVFGEDSLMSAVEAGDMARACARLDAMHERLSEQLELDA